MDEELTIAPVFSEQSAADVSSIEETPQERHTRLKKTQRANRRAKIKKAFEEETERINIQATKNFYDRYGIVEEYEKTVPMLMYETRKRIEEEKKCTMSSFLNTMAEIAKRIDFYTILRFK